MVNRRTKLNSRIQSLKEQQRQNPSINNQDTINALEAAKKSDADAQKKKKNVRLLAERRARAKEAVSDAKGPPSINAHVDEPFAAVWDNADDGLLGDSEIGDLALGDYDLGVELPDSEAMNSNQEPGDIRLPTPQPTFSPSKPPTPPTTDTISPKGKESIVDIQKSKAILATESDRDKRMQTKYEWSLSNQDPVALSIEGLIEILEANPKQSVGGFRLTRYTLMQLLDGEWLDHEMVNMYAELLARDDSRTQVIHSTQVSWELMAINSPQGSEAKDCLRFYVEPETTTILIPTFVNGNHWMLCVARLPATSTERGTLEYYNSLHSNHWSTVCRNEALEVVRVLERVASVHNGNFPSTTWTVVERNCGPQLNSNDCGIFVAACAASVVLETSVPTRVDDFRAIMANQVLGEVRGTRPDWDVVKIHLTELGGNDTVGAQGNGEMEEDAGDDVVEYIGDKEVGEDFAERPILCEWPGCPFETYDQIDLETHLRQIHDRIMWVCRTNTCYRRFVSEEETRDHINAVHDGQSEDQPYILDGMYRYFDTNHLRRLHGAAESSWSALYNSKEMEQADITRMYEAYYNSTARAYFTKLGLLNQGEEALCRHVEQDFESRDPGTVRSTKTYNILGIQRSRAWWVLFLHQAEGPHLDKFIRNAVIPQWCQISHKCHWAFCLNVSHLEQVVRAMNDDRTKCKNRSRDYDGGCNALSSLHPHDHCLLDNPHGPVFNLPTPLPLSGPPLEKSGNAAVTLEGPCDNGCTITHLWHRHPHDDEKVLCNSCYLKVKRIKVRKTQTSRQKQQNSGPCFYGCKTSSSRWYKDPSDKTRTLCHKCYQRLRKAKIVR